MRYITLFCSFLVCSFSISAQTDLGKASKKNKNEVLHYASFYISTDILSFLNSVISKKDKNATLSGEVCFDHLYSFQLNVNLESQHFNKYKRAGFRISPEFRLYYLNENCSAFHIGTYCSFEEAMVSNEKNSKVKTHLEYKESIFETGLSGGYKVLTNDHWVINPAVYAGISNRFHFRSLEKINSPRLFTEAEMIVRVVLQVGYRF